MTPLINRSWNETISHKALLAVVSLLLVLLDPPVLARAQYDNYLYPVWHPSANLIAVTNAARVRVYSSDFTQLLDEYDLFVGSTPGLRVGHMAWSPDGTMLAVSLAGEDVDFGLQVWDLQSGERVAEIAETVSTDAQFVWGANSDSIAFVHIRSHGDHTIRLVDMPAGTVIREFEPTPKAGIYAFDWSPARNQAIVDLGGTNAGFYALDTSTGEFELLTMSFQLGSRFTYNSDGSLIAGVPRSNDSVVEVWNTETFDVVTTLSGHTSWIAAISWATNTTLATVSDDETTRIWDAQTGQQLDVLDTSYTSTPDFSPDGSLFAAAAIDQVNVIREVIGGDVLAALGSTTTPIADAGPDQTVTDSDNDGSEWVTLDGSGSTDNDGLMVSYMWKIAGVEIATGVEPQVNLPVGAHTIRLTVTDDGGGASSDEVAIVVESPPTPTPTPTSSNCRRKSRQDGKLRVLAMRVAQGQVCQLPSSLAHTRAEGSRLVTCRVPTLV